MYYIFGKGINMSEISLSEYMQKVKMELISRVRDVELTIHRRFDELGSILISLESEIEEKQKGSNNGKI